MSDHEELIARFTELVAAAEGEPALIAQMLSLVQTAQAQAKAKAKAQAQAQAKAKVYKRIASLKDDLATGKISRKDYDDAVAPPRVAASEDGEATLS